MVVHAKLAQEALALDGIIDFLGNRLTDGDQVRIRRGRLAHCVFRVWFDVLCQNGGDPLDRHPTVGLPRKRYLGFKRRLHERGVRGRRFSGRTFGQQE